MKVSDQIAIPHLQECGSKPQKCRLMLFTDSFIHGGTERQLVELLRQIDRSRYEVIVGCLKKRGPFLPEVELLGFPVVEFPIRSLHDLTTLRELRRLLGFLKESKIDVVHTFDFYSNAFAAPAARLSRVPVVITSLREIVSQRRWSHRWISRLSSKAGHCVVANSRAAAKPIFGDSTAERLEIVRNGIQVEKYAARLERSEMRSRLGIPEGALLVGVLAALRPEKGHAFFLRAAAEVAGQVPSAKFVLIGDGTERQKLERLAVELGIREKLVLLGDRTDVAECLSILDVAVSPSPSESLSNAILEAMASGLPVVATRTGGTPELIEDGRTGYLIAVADSHGLANRITALLENAHLRSRLGADARARIEQEFASPHMWERLDRVYQKMLRKRLSSARIMHIGNFPPPLCGWSIHTMHLHRALLERGAESSVIDIGPNHQVARQECIPVFGGFDYLRKVWRASRAQFTFNATVNGDSWKGFILAAIALLIGRLHGRPALLTFRAGPQQMLFPRSRGFWYHAFQLLFMASRSVICEGEPMKQVIGKYVSPDKIYVISPFTSEYMDENLPVALPHRLEEFIARRSPLISSYSLFRPEFEMEYVFAAFALLKLRYPNLGLVIAGPDQVPPEIDQMLHKLDLADSVLIAGNLLHAEFLTLVQRSCLFLRSHRRDGVCASVLETLRLGVPVVAVEDGIRPKSVITYPAANVQELEKTLDMVLRNLDRFRAQVVAPDVPNSLEEEVAFLLRAGAIAR